MAEEGKIHATIGPYLFQTHRLATSKGSDPIMSGFTLIAEGDVDYNGGIEISISYLQKIYPREVGDKVNIEKNKKIYVNTGYRHWFNKKYSAGLSFFSAYSMGGTRVVRSDFPLSSRPPSSAKDPAEYGFEFSLQYEPIQVGKFFLVVDGRYSHSVTSKDNEDGNHYGLILGLKYFIEGSKF